MATLYGLGLYMIQRVETPVLINAAGAAIATAVSGVLWRQTGMLAPLALVPLALYAFVVSVAGWVRLRMSRTASEEARDAEAASRDGTSSALFAGAEADLLPLGRARGQLERFVVPWVAPLCAILLWVAARRIQGALNLPAAPAQDPLLVAAVCGGLLFGAFLISRFLLGLEKEARERLLRGPAHATGLFGTAAAATAAAALGLHTGFAHADRWVTITLLLLQVLVAAELALNTIGSLYRSRRSRTPHLSYESRVAGLFTRPEGLLKDLAQALEYQFGWEVSEHRLARGLVRVLAPLILLQLVLLWLSTSLVFIDAGETALLERGGRPLPGRTMEPGAHLKWPWPFETLRRFPTGRLLTTHVGYDDRPAVTADMRAGLDEATAEALSRAYLWTVPHYLSEDLFLAAARTDTNSTASAGADVPVNLYTVNVPVEYCITNAWEFAYNHMDPRALIEAVAYRTITRVCMTRSLADFNGPGRARTAEAVRQGIQDELNARAAGVEITFVGLQGVHPPVAVAPAYELEIGALEERDTEILRANQEAAQTIEVAGAEAAVLLSEARADKVRRIELARAAGDRFTRQLAGWTAAPEVFRARFMFDALERALAEPRKIIVAADAARRVVNLDLEEPMDLSTFELQDIPGLGPGAETKP